MCIVDEQGKKSERKFGVSTRDIKVLSTTLKSHYVSEVCMESTGIYWKPVWHLLENDFRMYLVNPQFIKQLPGRKSDVKDAEWIATVLLKNLVRNSFVPGGMIWQLRLYGRRINELNKDIVRCEQRVDMSLFATAAAMVSWAGLGSRNDESAGKIKSRKITHGNKYLRKALMEVAWGASRTRGSIFYNKFWRLRQRGKKQQKCCNIS